jgi:predicted HTH domain antitoxin
MAEMKLKYPEGLAEAVKTTPEELEHEIRLMAALKMFELGKLSSGKAAELAGISRLAFLELCSRYRVPVAECEGEDTEAEIDADLANLQRAYADRHSQ